MIINMNSQAREMNFCVKAYSSLSERPQSGRENEIAVITSVPVSSWVFASEEPEEKTEGLVWFRLGMRSEAKFNAARKNGIVLSPIDCKQYHNGSGEEKDAYGYVGGEWKKWIMPVYYYEHGLYEERFTDVNNAVYVFSENESEGSISLTTTWRSVCYTKATYDIGLYTYIRLRGTVGAGGVYPTIGVGETTDDVMEKSITMEAGKEEYLLNISSLSGQKHIKIFIPSNGVLVLKEISLL